VEKKYLLFTRENPEKMGNPFLMPQPRKKLQGVTELGPEKIKNKRGSRGGTKQNPRVEKLKGGVGSQNELRGITRGKKRGMKQERKRVGVGAPRKPGLRRSSCKWGRNQSTTPGIILSRPEG